MAYNESLGRRIRTVLDGRRGVVEKKMFGGLAFMLNGNMCCGVIGDDLMVRVGPNAYQETLTLPGARPMDFTGRPMKGMVYVAAERLDDEALTEWVARGVSYADSLPAK